MRATNHNGRVNKSGTAYSARHNDRDFDTTNADHIDSSRTSQNRTAHIGSSPSMTFEEAEIEFYKKTFGESLERQNERHRKSRHTERIKTIENIYRSPLTCPEECILQVGDMLNHIDGQTLWAITREYGKWHQQTFPLCSILDVAMHMDESTPHVHIRRVWCAKSRDGWIVSQTQSLSQMGIDRPDMTRPRGRYNNAKQTYTQMCREQFIAICQANGIQIEREPMATNQTHLDTLEFKISQTQQELQQTQERLDDTQHRLNRAMAALQRTVDAANIPDRTNERTLFGKQSANVTIPRSEYKSLVIRANLNADLATRQSNLDRRQRDMDIRERQLNHQSEQLQAEREELERRQNALNRRIDDFQQREDNYQQELLKTANNALYAIGANADVMERARQIMESVMYDRWNSVWDVFAQSERRLQERLEQELSQSEYNRRHDHRSR